MISKTLAFSILLATAAGTTIACCAIRNSGPHRVTLVFSEGHATDPCDMGRPVVLIASALGVPPEVFREAFTHVTPARDGAPQVEQVHQNKGALLSALGSYGVTNDRLDEVSDYYRYRPQDTDLWNHSSASGYAIITHGTVSKIVITDHGHGYSSPPSVSIPGTPTLRLKAVLHYGKDLEDNGSVSQINLISTGKP